MEERRAGELADRWVRHYEDAPWEPDSGEQAQARTAMVHACVALVPSPTASAALPLKDQPPVIAAIAESTLSRVRLSAVERPEAECLFNPLPGLERSLSVTHYLAEGGFGIMRHDRWTFRLGARI
jgi:hypothetical protein